MNYQKPENILKTYLTKKEIGKIQYAYKLAKEAHKDQLRKSGEPYIEHPLTVAYYLSEYQADAETIMAALLHDTVEDTSVTFLDLEKKFGPIVSRLVDGVTKFKKEKFRHAKEKDQKIETLRKMFELMQNDIRIVLIKLFDRLHNMRTLDGHSDFSKKMLIAKETLELYVRLSYYLGIYDLKQELENLALPYVYLDIYEHFCKKISKKKVDYQNKFLKKIKEELGKNDKNQIIKKITIKERSLLEIWEKYHERPGNYLYFQDLIIINLLVENEEDCYKALQIAHKSFQPHEKSFIDYIQSPKENGYRSIHTQVHSGFGEIIPIHINSLSMDIQNRRGITTSCFEKENNQKKYSWIQTALKLDENTKQSSFKFWEALKNDILGNKIFVYINDRHLEVPINSTVLDVCAYAFAGKIRFLQDVQINNRKALLEDEIKPGDVFTAKFHYQQNLNFLWLKKVNTYYGQNIIIKILKNQHLDPKINLNQKFFKKIFQLFLYIYSKLEFIIK